MSEVDYAQLAESVGGKPAEVDYGKLAKDHGGKEHDAKAKAKADEKSALDKDATTQNYLYRGLPGVDVEVPHTSGLNQFLISTGRGMVDLWAGGNQIVRAAADIVSPQQTKQSDIVPGGKSSRLSEYTKGQEEELKLFKPMEEEAPVTSTLGRVVGQSAPLALVPGGAYSQGARALSKVPMLGRLAGAGVGTDAAVGGGLQGFMNFTPEGESRAANTAEGAAVGGVAGKALQYGSQVLAGPLSKVGGWIKGKADEYLGKTGLAEMAGTKTATTTDELAASLEKEGIDWTGLPQQVRESLKGKADDAAKAGAPVTAAELARVVRAQNLPGGAAELTKGQMTQNRSQLRDEFNMRRTKIGQTLDDQLVQQDKVLADSLDVIKLKTGGTTTAGRESDAGQKITQPLLDQLSAAQSKVNTLYKAADESGQTLQKVELTPLVKWVEDNFSAMHSAPAMKSLVADLKKSGLVTFTEDGVATAGREPTIREVEALRQAMVKWGKADGASGSYMGEAKRVLDGITDGKGGELYAKARAARIELRDKFEDPGVINRLVSEKPGGDRSTAFEDVFKRSVIDSSVDDLTTLRGQLLQGGGDDPKLQAAGVQAFKDLRAATLDYIKLGAVDNAKGEFSYAGLKKAVDSIGSEKLEALFGKNTANQLMSVVEAAKDMKSVYNKTGVYNPGTASAGMDWLINTIDHVTGIVGLGKSGTYARIFVKGGVEKLSEIASGPRAVEAASKPVESAMRAGEAAKDDLYRKAVGLYAGKIGARVAPAVAAGAVAAEPEQQQ